MKLLVDMNLTPEWIPFLSEVGVEAVHWVALGHPRTPDPEIMTFAREHNYVVLTHDLDFGNILAATNARGPSVVQVRTQNPTPEFVGGAVTAALSELRAQLERGALVTIELTKRRSRILPLFPTAG